MCLDLLFETSSLKEWKQIAILWQAKRRKRNYFARLGLPRDFSAFGSAKGPVSVWVCQGTSHCLGLSRDLTPLGSAKGPLRVWVCQGTSHWLGLSRDFSPFGSAKGPVNVSVCRGTSHRLGLSRDLSPFGSVEGSLCGRIKVTAAGVGSTMKSLGLNTNCQAAIQPWLGVYSQGSRLTSFWSSLPSCEAFTADRFNPHPQQSRPPMSHC